MGELKNIDLIELGERVRNLRGDESQPVFAEFFGVTRNEISRLELGRAQNPSLVLLLNICRRYNITLEWLLTGDGEQKGNLAEENSFVYVPKLEVVAEAGGGFTNHDEREIDHLAFRSDWIQQLRIKPENLRSIQASGDSMEPTIREGDELLVDMSRQEISVDGIYCLRLSVGELVVKRVQRMPDGHYIIASDNTKYQPYPVTPGKGESISVVGRVVWIGRKL